MSGYYLTYISYICSNGIVGIEIPLTLVLYYYYYTSYELT